jgi:diguanylate cyclase (GGDEF)-like protein
MNSTVGLIIQCVGIVLLTLLSLIMRSSIRRASLKYWTLAWFSLSISLISLLIAFEVEPARIFLYPVYFFAEYAFGLTLIAGCHHHATGGRLGRSHLYLLVPAAAVALVLPHLSADFNDLFVFHATILAGLFGASFFALRPAFKLKGPSTGLRVLSGALLLLTIDFMHYVPVFGMRDGAWGLRVPSGYLQYTSIFDLILEVVLGFGTMMVLLEGVRHEVETANDELTKARDQLELLAQMDPLTEALNRHAFHSLLSRNKSELESDIYGCVAVIDIDNLKPINDSFGHSVGDKAIRAVARAVRSLIRADDMLFRWGGDEFLVLMFKLHKDEASRRMRSLNAILEENSPQWTSSPAKVNVSFGVSGFQSLQRLGYSIDQADRAMYSGRQLVRGKLTRYTAAYTDAETKVAMVS